MKDSIQNKIDRIKAISYNAPSKAVVFAATVEEHGDKKDSLSKVIRNEKEAAIFYAELKAAVTLAKSK